MIQFKYTVMLLQVWLCITNNSIKYLSFIYTHLNGFKHRYVIGTIQFKHTVILLQVLLCITYNSIKHLSFIYTRLNGHTVLFLTIRHNISHLFAHSVNIKQFYLTHR